MVFTNWLFLHCFKVWGCEGDGRVMSQVFVVFCYVDGRSGSQSRFADMKAGLGNFSKYSVMQQQPNVQSVFHKCQRKKEHSLGTKSSNRSLCIILGTPIHVGILLAVLIWHQYQSKELVLASLQKIFFTSILDNVDGKIQMMDHGLGILRDLGNIYIMTKRGERPYLRLNKIERQPSTVQKKLWYMIALCWKGEYGVLIRV